MQVEELSSNNFSDETRFTSQEVKALTNCWKMLSTKRKRHSVEFAIRLFHETPAFLSSFRVQNLDFENLHSHSLMVFDAVGFLILNLKNPSEFKGLLRKITETHVEKFVAYGNLNLSLNVLKDHIKESMKIIMSPTLAMALEKLCQIIELHHLTEYHNGVETRATVLSTYKDD